MRDSNRNGNNPLHTRPGRQQCSANRQSVVTRATRSYAYILGPCFHPREVHCQQCQDTEPGFQDNCRSCQGVYTTYRQLISPHQAHTRPTPTHRQGLHEGALQALSSCKRQPVNPHCTPAACRTRATTPTCTPPHPFPLPGPFILHHTVWTVPEPPLARHHPPIPGASPGCPAPGPAVARNASRSRPSPRPRAAATGTMGRHVAAARRVSATRGSAQRSTLLAMTMAGADRSVGSYRCSSSCTAHGTWHDAWVHRGRW